MFYYINGIVEEMLPGIAVIDCGGVGYKICTTNYTLSQLKKGEKSKLYIHTIIREDCFDLYGFATDGEKRCFEMLIGVSGVGPKAAISILSCTTPEMLAMDIISGNDKALTAAPGIGKKIAQRVVLELKDKMLKDTESISFRDNAFSATAPVVGNTKLQDASAALAVLGYSSAEINSALKNVDVENLDVQDIIKQSLKQMMK